MKKFTLILLATFILTGIYSIESCESSKASASKMMKFNLEKGKGYDYEMLFDISPEMMDQAFGTSMRIGYSVDVTDDDGNIKTLTAMYKNLKMNMKMMGKEYEMDTQKPITETSTDKMDEAFQTSMRKSLGSMIGKKFSIKVDKDGKVLEVNGFENIRPAIADSMGADSVNRAKMIDVLKDKINPDEVMGQFTDLFFIFPNKEVKVGDSWTKSYEKEKDGKTPVKLSTTYKVKEIEGEMVTLSSEGTIKFDTEKLKMEGIRKGILIVDSKNSLLVNGDFTQEFTTSLNGLSFTMNGKEKIKGTAR